MLALGAALALAACGGGDETTTVEAGAPTAEEDTEAIETLAVEYGLTDDAAEGCKLFSLEYLAELGGSKGCMSEKWFVEQIQVEEVSLDGDTATVIVVLEDGRRGSLPVVREGEPSDAYDGWKIAGEREPVTVAEAQPTPPATEEGATTPETATSETVSPPETPEEKAAAYRACVEGLGAKKVKQDAFPEVEFSGGGSFVRAAFGDSEEDAEQGLATFRQRGAPFAERFGTVVLYTVGDALAADLEIGLTCVNELG